MDFNHFTDPQCKSITTLDRPLLICAGAGSGKTFTLTQRITWALLPGSAGPGKPFLQDIGQALVITFTNKAASEIKERIRANLRAEGLVEQALKVDSAWISTIHGACLRIIREHALELGIDPEITLLDQTSASDMLESAIQAVLDRVQKDSNLNSEDATSGANSGVTFKSNSETVSGTTFGSDSGSSEATSPNGLQIHLSASFKVQNAGIINDMFTIYGVQTVHNRLVSILDKAATLTEGLSAFHLGPTPAPPHQMADAMIQSLKAASTQFTTKNAEIADALEENLEQFEANPNGTYRELGQMLHMKHIRAQKNKELVAEAKTLQQQLESEAGLALAYQHEQVLLSLAKQINEVYRQQLRAQGAMDMGGLIRFTLNAFKEHPDIAASYADRFKLIMVDEFQDTSQLQIDMIGAIANKDRSNLCTVGDSQQSIYRFQGADVNVYLAHKQRMTKLSGEDPQQLDANYRSHADILSFVRKVCGQKGYFTETFLDLHAQRDEGKIAKSAKAYKGDVPRVELVLSDASKTPVAVQTEAEHIARKFAYLHSLGHKASQMVVLLGITNYIEVYQDALRSVGLQCRAIGGSQFYEKPEVQLCQCILNAIANPLDSEKLLSVLSSDAVPVSSDDLLYLATRFDEKTHKPIRQDIGLGMFSDIPEQGSELLKQALKVFKRAWRDVGAHTPSQVFRNVVLESGWLLRLSKQGADGQSRAANVLKFISLLEDAEAKTGYDVVRLARYMEEAANSEHTRLGGLSVTDDDAVRLMTVHSSKGLEFPIVAVTQCYTSRDGSPSGKSRFALASQQKDAWMTMMPPSPVTADPAYANDDFAENMQGKAPNQTSNLTEFRYAVMALNHDADLSERRRLFYVAATRASEALIVSVAHKVTKNASFKDVEQNIVDAFWPDEKVPENSCELAYHDDVDGQDHRVTFTHLRTDDEGNVEGETLPTPSKTGSNQNRESGSQLNAQSHGQHTSSPSKQQDADQNSLSLIGQGETTIEIPELQKRQSPFLMPGHTNTGFFSFSSIAGSTEETLHEETEDAEASASEKHVVRPSSGAHNDAHKDARDDTHDDAAKYDSATDFGTALHKCCEWLAYQNVIPDRSARDAQAKRIGAYYKISQTDRLISTFENWAASDICHRAFSFASHQPETPFSIAVGNNIMEGSIDLLCTNAGHNGPDPSKALIIDYKTGGSPDETEDDLRKKHQLQGQCYAYAAMNAGFSEIEVCFVRVEHVDADGQPQIVRFTYNTDDKMNLKEHIAQQVNAHKN